MSGIPVVITDKYGIPVRQVTSGAPLMTVAANGRGIPIVLSTRGMAFVVEGANPVAPSAFTAGMWSIAPGNTVINVTINSLPYNGGSVITAVQYRLNGGSWVSSGGTGSFTINGLTNGTPYTVELRAVNAIGPGLDSDDKTTTPINNDFWQSFDMTAGTSINWVGYIRPSEPNPTGSITREPNPAHTMLKLIFDPVTDEVIAEFLGDVEDDMESFSLFVGGFEIELGYVTMLTGPVRTRAHYMTEADLFVSGNTYEVEFKSAAGIVELTRNDALSRFEITNTASFPGGTWTWYDDAGNVIAGQTNAYLPYSAVPTGKLIKARANGGAGTDSTLWAIPQNNTVWEYDGATSAIANGTDFAGQGGWVGPAGKLEFFNGHIRHEGEEWPPQFFTHDMPSTNYSFSAKLDIGNNSSGSYNSGIRELYVNYIDSNNFIRYTVTRNGFTAIKKVSGTETQIRGFSGEQSENGILAEFATQILDGDLYVKMFREGVRRDEGGENGILVTGLTPTARAAFSFYPVPDAGNPTIPFNIAQAMSLRAVPDVGISPLSFSYIDPSDPTPALVEVIALSDYTALQTVFLGTDGEELGSITNFTGLTAGEVTLSVPVPDAAQDVVAFLRIRQTANPANYIDYSLGEVPSFFIPPFEIGIQDNFIEEWGRATGERNLIMAGSIRKGSNYDYILPQDFGGGEDGIMRSYPSGETSLKYILPQSYKSGVYAVTYPAGMTIAAGNFDGYTVTQAFSGGYGEITASRDLDKNGFLLLSGTIPVGGIDIKGLPKADAHPERLYTDSARAAFENLGIKHIRGMTPLGVNVGIPPYDYKYGGGSGRGPLSHDVFAQLCKDVGAAPYINLLLQAEDSQVEQIAEVYDVTLAVGVKPTFGLSNEVWNSIFPAHEKHMELGVRRGYYNTNGDAGPTDLTFGGIVADGGELLIDVPMGGRIMSNVYNAGPGGGMFLWQANKNNVAGTADAVSTVSNTAWTVIANLNDCVLAGKRFMASRSMETWDVVESVLGAENIERAIEWKAGDGFAAVQPILEWQDCALRVDHVLIAPYFFGYSGINLGDWDAADVTGWTAADRALVNTNVPLFKDKFFAAVDSAVDAQIEHVRTYRIQLYEWLKATYGVEVARRVKLGSYECNHHINFTSDWPTAAWTVLPSLFLDARWGTALTRYFNGLKAQGGRHYAFDKTTAMPTTTGGNAFDNWGYQSFEADTANVRWLALQGFAP